VLLVFYVCAHQDDWFFFRGEQAFFDLQVAKVVFVTVTAGDGGCRDGWWEVRERSSIEAIRSAWTDSVVPIEKEVRVFDGAGTHPVLRYSLRNAVVYPLRLPDGGPNEPNLTSLRLDRTGSVALSAIDGSTTYSSWLDLCRTIESIFVSETRSLDYPTPWVNAPLYRSDPGRYHNRVGVNPGDHPDHVATGLAVKSFASGFYHRAWWWGYAASARSRMRIRDPRLVSKKRILFDAYYQSVTKLLSENGSRECSARWAAALPAEWRLYGPFGHAETGHLGQPDPY
jgi:hypothetical protein